MPKAPRSHGDADAFTERDTAAITQMFEKSALKAAMRCAVCQAPRLFETSLTGELGRAS